MFSRGDVSETVEAGVRIMALSHLTPYIAGKPQSMDAFALSVAIRSANRMYKDGKEDDKERQSQQHNSDRFRGLLLIGAVVTIVFVFIVSMSGSDD